MSGGFPRNFADLQRALQNAQQQGRRFGAGGAGGGGPRGIGAMAGLIFLGGGAWLVSNALFNGAWMLSEAAAAAVVVERAADVFAV